MDELSRSTEDFLKAVFELSEAGGAAGTTALARRLQVAPASVTGMLRRLAAQQPRLVDYRKHRGATLTADGRRRALEVIRHHRLIETFLFATLGVSWDQVHAEAERMEHAISEDLEDRIAAHLGNPAEDPHGGLIPGKDGNLPRREETRLSDLPVGHAAVVARVPDRDPDLLRRLAELELRPGAALRLMRRAPGDGAHLVRIGGGRRGRTIAGWMAEWVYVEPVKE